MDGHCRQVFALAIRAVIVGGAILGALNIRAQDALSLDPGMLIAYQPLGGSLTAGYSDVVSMQADHPPDKQTNPKRSAEFQDQASVGSASVGSVVRDFMKASSGSDSLDAMDIPAFWSGTLIRPDLVGADPVIFGASYDPFKTFDRPNGFAAEMIGLVPRLENIVRGGPVVSNALWAGVTPNTDWTKGGNNFEAGMTAQLVLNRKARYPITVTFPVYMAVGDEQYFRGPHFGYISAGIKFWVPLSFVPSRYGRWSAGGTADFCYYGTTENEFVKSIGLQVPKIAAALNVEL